MKTTIVPAEFYNAYKDAALWSSTYGEGDPMDDGAHDLSPEAEAAMVADCVDFFAYCESIGLDPIPDYGCALYSDAEKSGQDFWLTRNHHGAGYWDRGLETGRALTDAAHTFGSCDLYVGDDGLIYI
jgi:hypothetical protein